MEIGEFDVLVCEWPMFYEGEKGQTSARQGHTINLAGIAMFIAGWFQVPFKNLYLYTAPQWKGTVSKQVTAKRFLKLFGEEYMGTDHNAIDAIMLGIHHCKAVGYHG